ncbi:MAG: hypothetical protein LBR26_09030 [Prevotella sp.]|nr:hypothetical protein [Prevotella sp.]
MPIRDMEDFQLWLGGYMALANLYHVGFRSTKTSFLPDFLNKTTPVAMSCPRCSNLITSFFFTSILFHNPDSCVAGQKETGVLFLAGIRYKMAEFNN